MVEEERQRNRKLPEGLEVGKNQGKCQGTKLSRQFLSRLKKKSIINKESDDFNQTFD
jgi:DNA invertase Pin-like site-specific DNA recombinase